MDVRLEIKDDRNNFDVEINIWYNNLLSLFTNFSPFLVIGEKKNMHNNLKRNFENLSSIYPLRGMAGFSKSVNKDTLPVHNIPFESH